MLLALAPAEADAQCGASQSECRNCHEVRGAKPVLAQAAPWHHDHAFGDFCAICHGGDPQAKNMASAHGGLVAPLADVGTSCGSCHGVDSTSLANRYAAVSLASPAHGTPPPPAAPRRIAWSNVIMAAVVLLVGVAGTLYVVENERRALTGPRTGAQA